MRRVQVIFSTVPIAMKSTSHLCPHSDMARETTGVNGDSRSQADTLAHMVLRRHTTHAAICQQGLLHTMAHTKCGTGCNGPGCEMVVQSTYIHHTGKGWMIVQRNFSLR